MNYTNVKQALSNLVANIKALITSINVSLSSLSEQKDNHLSSTNPHGDTAEAIGCVTVDGLNTKIDGAIDNLPVDEAQRVGGSSMSDLWHMSGKRNLIPDPRFYRKNSAGQLFYPFPTFWGRFVINEIVTYANLPAAVIQAMPNAYNAIFDGVPNAWHVKFDDPPTSHDEGDGWFYFAPMANMSLSGDFCAGFGLVYVVSGEVKVGNNNITIKAGEASGFSNHVGWGPGYYGHFDCAVYVRKNTEAYFFMPHIVPGWVNEQYISHISNSSTTIFFGTRGKI